MSFDARQFVSYQIANAPLRAYPFAHLYVHPVFPPEAYDALQANLPPDGLLKPIDTAPQRHAAELGALAARDAFWQEAAGWLLSDAFRDVVIARFADGIRRRLGPYLRIDSTVDALFVRDFTGYAADPHAGSPQTLVSLVFYLARDAARTQLGTTIFRPIDSAERADRAERQPFSELRKVVSLEYRPNALFACLSTDVSFRAEEPIRERDVTRDLLLYEVGLRKVVVGSQARAG